MEESEMRIQILVGFSVGSADYRAFLSTASQPPYILPYPVDRQKVAPLQALSPIRLYILLRSFLHAIAPI